MLKVGTQDLYKLYVGDQKYREVYLGTTRVRPSYYTPGIYRNSVNGLISMSQDGYNWVTISDKNRGATQVWDIGSPLDQAHCGDYIQRVRPWNFPTGYTLPQQDGITFGTILTRGENIGAWLPNEYSNLKRYLKLPLYGWENGDTGIAYKVGQYGAYPIDAGGNVYTYGIKFTDTSAETRFLWWDRQDGQSFYPYYTVRLWSERTLIPDDSWTPLYIAPTPSYAPGIYHNPSSGLISMSFNGINWLTISDKNLGATQVYNYGNTLSQSNCGEFFQRGNNYGFPRSGTSNTDPTAIDVSAYGPSNYYSDSLYITGVQGYNTGRTWFSPDNADLRGGESSSISSKRGPCDTGYHVPTSAELKRMIEFGKRIGARSDQISDLSTYLKLPLAGYLIGGTPTAVGTEALYAGCEEKRSSNSYGEQANMLGLSLITYPSQTPPDSITIGDGSYDSTQSYPEFSVCRGMSIRPFKDTPEIPTSSRNVLYQPS